MKKFHLSIFSVLVTIPLFYLSSIFIYSNPSLYAFDMKLPDITSEQLNIPEGILNFLREEEDYIKFQDIYSLYNKTNSLSLSQDVLSKTFSYLLNKNSSFNIHSILYDRINSFFKDQNLSFYNARSYEQSFLRDDIDVADDWDHISERFMDINIITHQNRDNINSKLKIKSFSYENDFSITKSHRYFLDNNLVGMIEGLDKDLKDEFIVIGMSLKKYDSDTDGNLYAYNINQALTTSIFLSIIKNILDHKDLLKRSVMFVVFSDEHLHLCDSSPFFFSKSSHKDFNGAKAFLDYFDYYNSRKHPNRHKHNHNNRKKHSIYTFIDIEPLSYSLFLKNTDDTPEDLLPDHLVHPSSNYLDLLKILVKDINSLYRMNYITNNETLGSIFRTPVLDTTSQPIFTIKLDSVVPSEFLAYTLFKDRNISSLLFGTNPLLHSDNFTITEQQATDLISKYLDFNKIDSFIKTISISTDYLSIRNPELDLSNTENLCNFYFQQ